MRVDEIIKKGCHLLEKSAGWLMRVLTFVVSGHILFSSGCGLSNSTAHFLSSSVYFQIMCRILRTQS